MNFAIILAGGSGSRAGGPLPKQFQMLDDTRILWHSVKAFKSFDEDCRIILVVNPSFLKDWDRMFGAEENELGFTIYKTEGGATRIQSVKKGLEKIQSIIGTSGENPTVYIHDSARPRVTPDLMKRAEKLVRKGVGAIPVVGLSDSIRQLTGDGTVAVNRAEYMAVQTPQVFLFDDIKRAYDSLDFEEGLTDDASVAEKGGLEILTFEGDPANIKITNPIDFLRI